MKHVRESLADFNNKKYFDGIYAKLFEEETDLLGDISKDEPEVKPDETEEPKEEKSEEKPDTKETSKLQDKEKDALDIIKRIEDDFKHFKSAAKGQIAEFKTFWEENQQTKELFTETGNIYKMHDSDYVVGVLDLPTEVLSDGSIEGGLGAFQEEEEIIEGKPQEEITIEGDSAGIDGAAAAPALTEAIGDDEEDLDLEKPEGEEELLEPPTEEPTDVPTEEPAMEPEAPMEEPTDLPTEEPAMEPTPEAPIEEPGLPTEGGGEEGQPQTYLVVYDMASGEREEIFRNGSTNAVKAFRDFYENTFKGTMKAVIQEFKEKQQLAKKEAEAKEKERLAKEKQNKLGKFLKK